MYLTDFQKDLILGSINKISMETMRGKKSDHNYNVIPASKVNELKTAKYLLGKLMNKRF